MDRCKEGTVDVRHDGRLVQPGTLKWLDKAFLLETMDWINVMTYDYTGDWTSYAGHQSPLFASSKQPGGSLAPRNRP